MKNKSKITYRALIIAIAIFAAHFCTDIFKTGVKDGAATRHISAVKK